MMNTEEIISILKYMSCKKPYNFEYFLFEELGDDIIKKLLILNDDYNEGDFTQFFYNEFKDNPGVDVIKFSSSVVSTGYFTTNEVIKRHLRDQKLNDLGL